MAGLSVYSFYIFDRHSKYSIYTYIHPSSPSIIILTPSSSPLPTSSGMHLHQTLDHTPLPTLHHHHHHNQQRTSPLSKKSPQTRRRRQINFRHNLLSPTHGASTRRARRPIPLLSHRRVQTALFRNSDSTQTHHVDGYSRREYANRLASDLGYVVCGICRQISFGACRTSQGDGRGE